MSTKTTPSQRGTVYSQLSERIAVVPLAWVPWVPGNPSIFEQLVPEPINFGRRASKNVQGEPYVLGHTKTHILKGV